MESQRADVVQSRNAPIAEIGLGERPVDRMRHGEQPRAPGNSQEQWRPAGRLPPSAECCTVLRKHDCASAPAPIGTYSRCQPEARAMGRPVSRDTAGATEYHDGEVEAAQRDGGTLLRRERAMLPLHGIPL
jgi:hypothetical protein